MSSDNFLTAEQLYQKTLQACYVPASVWSTMKSQAALGKFSCEVEKSSLTEAQRQFLLSNGYILQNYSAAKVEGGFWELTIISWYNERQ